MRKLLFICVCSVALAGAISSCQNKPQSRVIDSDTIAEPETVDSTVYGVCGENTSMHSLELITDAGDTLLYIYDADEESPVVGGLLAGDRLAVVNGQPLDGERTAKKIINLTTLIGKWTSLDKNFEIQEGGVVVSTVEAEKNHWTSWKILNGQLLLNRDTFDIDNLGSDSLYLENKEGIFVYNRVK